MVRLALAFAFGLLLGVFYPHSTPPPPPEIVQKPCPPVPPPPKCEANKDLVIAAEMIQKEFLRCNSERTELTEQLDYSRRGESNLQREVDDWRDRYYQSQ